MLLTTNQVAASLGITRAGVHHLLSTGVLSQSERGVYQVHLVDSELVEEERQRRRDRHLRQLARLGYTAEITAFTPPAIPADSYMLPATAPEPA